MRRKKNMIPVTRPCKVQLERGNKTKEKNNFRAKSHLFPFITITVV